MQSHVKFNRVPKKVPEKDGEALVQSQVRFNRVVEKVPEKVMGGFGAKAGQVQQGSGEGSGEGLGDFGAEPGQVQQGSGEGSGEGLGGYLVQSQVRFNRIPKKVPQKVQEGFGAEPCQVQQGSRRRFRRRSGRLRCRVNRVPEKVWKASVQSQQGSGEGSGEGLGGFGAEHGQVQQDLRPFNSRNPS